MPYSLTGRWPRLLLLLKLPLLHAAEPEFAALHPVSPDDSTAVPEGCNTQGVTEIGSTALLQTRSVSSQTSAVVSEASRDPVVVHPDSSDARSDSCTPQCSWQCETSKCDQACRPVCTPPHCQTRCKEFDTSGCHVECERPDCAVVCPKRDCPKRNCPACYTTCSKPRCRMRCDDRPQPCQHVCIQPECRWECHKPHDCPKPNCVMHCDKPRDCLDTVFHNTSYDQEKVDAMAKAEEHAREELEKANNTKANQTASEEEAAVVEETTTPEPPDLSELQPDAIEPPEELPLN